MAATSSSEGSSASRHGDGWATGAVVFAAVILLISGILAILQGASAVAKDKVYLVAPRYTYQFDLTGWGWVHIVLGILALGVGGGLLAGQAWARWAGIVIAGLSLIAQFLWLPYYPLWTFVVMALDVFVIWGLARNPRINEF